MMVSVETYLRRWQRQLRQWTELPGMQTLLQASVYAVGGLLLSAASLGGTPQPIAMGLCCAVTGWRAVVVSLGSMLGYRLFWGDFGVQGMLWAGMGGLTALLLGKRSAAEDTPLLIPSLSAFGVAATGLIFQLFWMDDTSFGIYSLRIALAALMPLLFRRRIRRGDSLSRWLCDGINVLALAQVAPVSWLGLGYMACGFLAVSRAFPGVVLAGLGLDLAQITPIPMTAVVCTACIVRNVPGGNPWVRYVLPTMSCIGVMALWGSWDPAPLPGLLLGGVVGAVLCPAAERIPRQGTTGHIQVQLELTAGVMARTQQLLMEVSPAPVDESALLEKVRTRACGTCSARASCREQEALTLEHLRQPADFTCRKPGRILGELRRGREQLYTIRSDRRRQQEYRWALVQQYQFLSEYLRSLSDRLGARGSRPEARYRIHVAARSRGKGSVNGDRCMAFPGSGCRCFVLLCDGMGTGLGAAREGQNTLTLLREMLTAGFPAEHAFRSVNSILALRGQAGAVTLDLAEVRLDTGKVTLYKWGAAPSWLLNRQGAKKIGTATPPPGISVTDAREMVVKLSVGRGETLILLSDGVEVEELLRRGELPSDLPAGELASGLLARSRSRGDDDATAAVIRLQSIYPGAV